MSTFPEAPLIPSNMALDANEGCRQQERKRKVTTKTQRRQANTAMSKYDQRYAKGRQTPHDPTKQHTAE